MPLFDHIGELRRRLTIIIVSLLGCSLLLWFFAPSLIWVLVQPVTQYINHLDPNQPITNIDQLNTVLYTFNPLEGFAIKFKVAFVFSLVVCSPIWIWQLLGFFLPALKPKERKWVIPTFIAMVALFAAGMVFCYFIILDASFSWLLGQSEDFSSVLPSAKDFINTILLFEVAFGIAFEMPLVVFYLTVFRIIKYKDLRKNWRVIYIVLLTLCAMITPDANPVTMILMFAAMAILYEGSLFLSRIVLAKRIAQQQREEAGEYDDEEDQDEAAEGNG